MRSVIRRPASRLPSSSKQTQDPEISASLKTDWAPALVASATSSTPVRPAATRPAAVAFSFAAVLIAIAIPASSGPSRRILDRSSAAIERLAVTGVGLLRDEIATCADRANGRFAGVDQTARAAIEQRIVLDLVGAHRTVAQSGRRQLVEVIHSEAIAVGADPLLVGAIVAEESSFRSETVSPMGAMGLMQLRPFVAQALADRLALDWAGEEVLFEPAYNVRLGVRYFQDLLDDFGGDTRKALTAYNFGPERVRERERSGDVVDSLFARRVLRTFAMLDRERRASLDAHRKQTVDLPVLDLAIRFLTLS